MFDYVRFCFVLLYCNILFFFEILFYSNSTLFFSNSNSNAILF